MYYKWKRAYEEKGKEGLQPKYRKKDPELERLKRENERLKKLLAEKNLRTGTCTGVYKKNLNDPKRKAEVITRFCRNHSQMSINRACKS